MRRYHVYRCSGEFAEYLGISRLPRLTVHYLTKRGWYVFPVPEREWL